MTTMREFVQQIDAYNARVAKAEMELRALHEERDILRNQAGDFMRLSQFDMEIASFAVPRFSYPEGYVPPEQTGGQPAEQPIVRHPDQAAE